MTVKELKEAIADLPDDMEVILQTHVDDTKGSPVHDVDPNAIYVPETELNGELYSPDWNIDFVHMSEERWEQLKLRPRVLVLYP